MKFSIHIKVALEHEVYEVHWSFRRLWSL